ncbi:MAG: hypothetical protein GW911_19160 [Armatimonadetes bacterium]|nr:hypothetical protein [Armatimonadota bacterium]NCO91083.1 hypothetical protein [Armatimonadota bacterium]NCP33011.1 hypothetical protein [Armatimonadota bacterium]NCQ32059.1 hypothetical protein [Armatimonadota bacterium]NDK14154.1 hypothetical protein [Armatimonadota bacterium]
MRPTPTAGTRSDLDLGALTRSLLRADPEIRDIVLFGSMAYAPELAHDVDVLITTRRKKDIEVYWDATADFPRDVDVLVREPGERVSDSIAASVCAWRAVLHGNGETFREASETMAVPTFEDVRAIFRNGDSMLALAQHETNAATADHGYRTAFGILFDVARNAAQAFLNTDNSRWGELRRALPRPLDQEFHALINTLHVQYSYDGHYPKDRADEEYQRWRVRVAKFVDDLEEGARAGVEEPGVDAAEPQP